MRLLSSVNQVVFLQVGQLCEVLIAGLTPEGTLPAVHSQMDLRTPCKKLVFTFIYSLKLNKPGWLFHFSILWTLITMCNSICSHCVKAFFQTY